MSDETIFTIACIITILLCLWIGMVYINCSIIICCYYSSLDVCR